MATKSGNNSNEHLQRSPGEIIKSNLQDESATTDLAGNAATMAKALFDLNQCTISHLEKVIKDDSTADLWPILREATRNYKAKRKEFIEGPKSQDEGE